MSDTLTKLEKIEELIIYVQYEKDLNPRAGPKLHDALQLVNLALHIQRYPQLYEKGGLCNE